MVQPGDTLWDLSRKYMETPSRWTELQRDNAIEAPRRLQPGTVLSIGSSAAVVEVNGDAILQRGSHSAKLSPGAELQPLDVVVTGLDGFVALQFSDGSRVAIPSRSAARLITAHAGATRIELLHGRAESYVEKQRQREFEIRTRGFALGVRGTHFRARADGGTATLEVLEGKVLATPFDAPAESALLEAGQGIRLDARAALAPRALLGPPRQAPALQPPGIAALPVAGAELYQVQLADDPAFLRVSSELRAERPVFDLPRDAKFGFLHARFTAFDADLIEGQPGAGLVFNARDEAPENVDLRSNPRGERELRWPLRHSGRHTFVLSRRPDFSDPVVHQQGNFAAGVGLGALPPGDYYWRCVEVAGGDAVVERSWEGRFSVPG